MAALSEVWSSGRAVVFFGFMDRIATSPFRTRAADGLDRLGRR